MAHDQNKDDGLSRRKLMHLLGGAGTIAILGPTGLKAFSGVAQAQAATAANKFVVYIHCGAWDGLAAGLLQPQTPNTWQRGLFYPGQAGESVNPNLNVHHKVGNLILNNYTKPLATIADHVCFAVTTPQSLSHDDARRFQHTGSKDVGANPSWVTGFAQANYNQTPQMTIVSTEGIPEEQSLGSVAKNVTVINGASLATFRANFDDSSLVPKGEHANKFWGVLKALHKRRFSASTPSDTFGSGMASYVDNLVSGQPKLMDGSTDVMAVQTAFNRTKINAVIDSEITDANDGAGVKTTLYNDLMDFLQLAGVLAKTGIARGASINLDVQDLHGGGSSVTTARSGSQLFSQLSAFWKGYVIPQNLQDSMLIIVSHEFSRTPYNNATAAATNVVFNGQPVAVQSPGTDHQLVNGMVFIGGGVPGKGRVGGLGDYYSALGSKDLTGMAQTGTSAYTSADMVGSMLMRSFPELFNNERTVRGYWSQFTPLDVVLS